MKHEESIPGFDPNAGTPIDAKQAGQWAANYRDQPQTEAEKDGRKRINAYYFGNELLDKIQQQPGCVGVRFYMGLEGDMSGKNGKQQYQLLAVGVDENGYDLVPRSGSDGVGIVGDATLKCPPVCDPGSPMNI